MTNAKPVLADIRPDTLTLDPESVKEALTSDTTAILPVHYAGQATDMDVFLELAADHDLAIIEDAAHALGGSFQGEALGTLGDIGCFSFYATKSITTSEGGMAVTDSSSVAHKLRKLRMAGVDKSTWERTDHEQPSWYYDVTEVSGKYNMNDIQASIGLAQLERLDGFLQTRRRLSTLYDERFGTVDNVTPLSVRSGEEHARHLYPVLLDVDSIGITREEFYRRLVAEGIQTSVHYIPIHHHTAFQDVERVGLETTDEVAERLLCLPLHPAMDESDVSDVVTAVQKVSNE
jgi:dTDP-4-amino-4,6-dideoxygalactose transaminase